MTTTTSELGSRSSGVDLRWAFRASAALVVAYLVSVILRPNGSYYAPVDGWGVDVFELSMGVVCIRRFFDPTWRASHSAARVFPLVLGAACISWGLGDVARTIESLGGATPSVPSVADGFYVGFYPLCFASFVMVIRRGNTGSLVATALDGLIAGIGVAAVSAAFLFSAVLHATGGGVLAAATNMAYPVGDLLLLSLAIGGITILPREYRRFLVIASVAIAANAIGDTFNLLQPNSTLGYVCNAVAWPISLLMLAIGDVGATAERQGAAGQRLQRGSGGEDGRVRAPRCRRPRERLRALLLVHRARRHGCGGARDGDPVRRGRPLRAHRARGAGRELGSLPLADRQGLGSHRGGRSRSRGRLHHAVVGAGARLCPARAPGHAAHRHRPSRRRRGARRAAAHARRRDEPRPPASRPACGIATAPGGRSPGRARTCSTIPRCAATC